jgi:RHS repeat-associated protein
MSSVRFVPMATLLSSLFLNVALAQTTSDQEQGMKPFGLYDVGNIDVVNLMNGNVYLHSTLLSYPQRGGKLPLQFFIRYNNKGYTSKPVNPNNPNGPRVWVWSGAGVDIGREGQTAATDRIFKGLDQGGGQYMVHVCTLITADGATHQLTGNANQLCTLGGGRTLDATGMLGSIDHRGISPTADTNGNQITINSSGWTDTLGRLIPGSNTSSSSNNEGYSYGEPFAGVATTDFSGCPSPVAAARTWNVPGPGGTASYKFCYRSYSYSTNFGITGYSETSGTAILLNQINLPNGTAWSFSYNSYLDLTSVTLPTGGSISYGWTNSSTCGGTNPTSRTLSSRTVNDNTGAHTANYAYSTCQITVTDALQNDTVHTFTNGYETDTKWYQGTGSGRTLLKTIDTTYSFTENPFDMYTGGAATWINVVPLTRKTTWPSGQVAQANFTYDSGASFQFYDAIRDVYTTYPVVLGELTQQVDYDYGNGSPGAVLRTTNTTYAWQSPNPNYASYLSNNLLDRVETVQVLDGSSTQIAYTTSGYDELALQASNVNMQKVAGETYPGNLTSIRRWLNNGTFTCPDGSSGGSGGYLVSHTTDYDTGTPYISSDPCNHSTMYTYSGTYYGAYATTITNALGQATNKAYDFNSGALTSTTDPNQLVTSHTYDSLVRLSQTTHPDNAQDTITRQESGLPFTATLTSTINTTQNSIPLTVFDRLGRVSQTQLTSDPQGTVYKDTTYDAMGRVASVSNPYRTGTDATSSTGTTSYTYDALSRKTKETEADGVSTVNTAYCGSWTLVTDATGKWRRSRSDALGRLVEVDEPNSTTANVNSTGCPGTNDPVWITSYSYDAIGNLTQVVQNGSHTRTFTYDSLARLLTSNNPETGTITYTYNPDGTVLTKKDAQAITTCFGDWSSSNSTCTASTGYDALHRVLKVTYSNGDPTQTFAYDGGGCLGLSACQNIGHRTGMTDGAGSESWAYQVDKTNSRGIHREQRTTNGITKTTTYYLDLAGNITEIAYPTGRVVNYTHDSANRPSSASDGSSGVTYVADWMTPPANTLCTPGSVCYTPQGAPYSMSLGQTSSFNGFNILETFNNRLQPNEIKGSSSVGTAFDILYNFVDPVSQRNAGHVYAIANNLNASRSQTFTYDQLNRILSAGTTATSGTYCWGNQYSYDPWGNLLQQSGWSPTYNSCTETTMGPVNIDANSHIVGFSYDASGNTQNDGVYSYTWDAEGQLKTAGGVTYSYDGDGRRAAKVGSKLYWYGSGGEILAETDASGNTLNEYVYFGGKRVAVVPASGAPLYYAEDMLGSSRVIVQSNGTLCYDADFTPFGGERSYANTCPQNFKFEGKERDTETQNDDFGAREYSWRFGRWLSADWSSVPVAVPYANLTNPQTLNLYGMVTDDPESFADLDGHATGFWGSGGEPMVRLLTESGYVFDNALMNPYFFSIAEQSEAKEKAQNQTQTQTQQNQKKGNTAPPNSRTDVQLYGREYTPTPGRELTASWEMDWYVGACSKTSCPQPDPNKNNGTASLVESLNGGPWKPTGDPGHGEIHDQISPEAKTFNQHWFVDGKQVQLVVGKDSNGNLIKTWEVHVVINKTGDRPVYSPVPVP